MCNLAGYSGSRSAAPVLLEMLKKEEAFDGGFYSGIATIHEGKIYHAKVLGDVQTLIDNTDALSLPGNIGIAHSRPGLVTCGKEWAHPFIGYHDNEAKIAYIANGYVGFASPYKAIHNKIARDLDSSGFTFTSTVESTENAYCKLSGDLTVHISDVMCNLILRNILNGSSPEKAMADAYCEMPSEIVGLMLCADASDKIFFSRINQPMFLSYSEDGAYLATTAIAFPENVSEPQLLPANTSGYVGSSGYSVTPFSNPVATVAPIDAGVYHAAYNFLYDTLKKEKKSYYNPISGLDLPDLVRPFFGPADCAPISALSYSILYALMKEGKLNIDKTEIICPNTNIHAPHFLLSAE